jgi:hypothetical protein
MPERPLHHDLTLRQLVERLSAAVGVALRLEARGALADVFDASRATRLYALLLPDGATALPAYPGTSLTESELKPLLRAALAAVALRQEHFERPLTAFLRSRDWLADEPDDWRRQDALVDALDVEV